MYFFEIEKFDAVFKPRSLEHAYLALINSDLTTAKAVFESLDSPRARWGISLVEILSGFLEHYPTYFEIRNFFEIDLDMLIKNEKTDYVEQLLGSLDFLSNINQEVYKYAARVMIENKMYNVAMQYMEKSKKIFYNDPELHFMLSKFNFNNCDYVKADYHINECLKIVNDYYPALKLQTEIRKYFD